MFLSGKDEFCNPSLENVLPEAAPGIDTAERRFYLIPKFPGNAGKAAIGGRD